MKNAVTKWFCSYEGIIRQHSKLPYTDDWKSFGYKPDNVQLQTVSGVKKNKPKIFSEMVEQIEAKLHVWLPVQEEQKVHTYDVIGHMIWQSYWIYPKTY